MEKPRVYDFTIETRVSPERLVAAATDFSERRPDLWPGISRSSYRVFSLGDHTADVEEGTSPVHHRYHYEWTDDGTVRAITTDATVMKTGSVWQMRVRPLAGGGSVVQIHVEMGFKGAARFVGPLVMGFNGGGIATYRKWFVRTLHALERETPVARSTLVV
jgi:hypothetical protein